MSATVEPVSNVASLSNASRARLAFVLLQLKAVGSENRQELANLAISPCYDQRLYTGSKEGDDLLLSPQKPLSIDPPPFLVDIQQLLITGFLSNQLVREKELFLCPHRQVPVHLVASKFACALEHILVAIVSR